jgi:hypothetical protein
MPKARWQGIVETGKRLTACGEYGKIHKIRKPAAFSRRHDPQAGAPAPLPPQKELARKLFYFFLREKDLL